MDRYDLVIDPLHRHHRTCPISLPVLGREDALAGEIPKACIVLKAGQTATEEELIEFCAGRIAPYKRIREVEFIDEVPKTPVGKMLRRVLRDKEK